MNDAEAKAAGYDFTADWFSLHTPVWDRLIDQVRPTRILEIGSYEGRSAAFLIERCAASGPIELTCIDTWRGGVEHDAAAMGAVEQRFDHNLALARKRAGHPVALRKIKEGSFTALAKLVAQGEMGAFDFVYIDGSHQAPDVLADAVLGYALTRVNGVIAFDDYLWFNEPEGQQNPLNMPKPGIDAFVNLYQRKLRVVLGAPLNQFYVIKKA